MEIDEIELIVETITTDGQIEMILIMTEGITEITETTETTETTEITEMIEGQEEITKMTEVIQEIKVPDINKKEEQEIQW